MKLGVNTSVNYTQNSHRFVDTILHSREKLGSRIKVGEGVTLGLNIGIILGTEMSP